MKTFKHFLFLCFLSVLVACTEDTFMPQSEISPIADGNSVAMISMVVPDIEMDATTRSKLQGMLWLLSLRGYRLRYFEEIR